MSNQKHAWAFRTPEPLTQQIEQFADENEMSQSDALRTLVRSGLEAEEIREEMNELEERVERLEDSGIFSRLF